MALTMDQLKKLLNQTNSAGPSTEAAAAQLVADALLRGVGRQAIIAAAADAVAQLGGGNSGGLSSRGLLHLLNSSLPGGPIDDGEPDDDKEKRGNSGTGPS